MCNRLRRYFSILIIICLSLLSISYDNVAYAEDALQKRLFGNDRYQTAVAISRSGWQSGSDYVILARGDDFPDALCAGPLAKKYSAPILLTQPDVLNDDVLNEIKRLNAKHVIIIGGQGAVGTAVEDRLREAGISDIERIWGADRYLTSVEIAKRLDLGDSIALATGMDYPDALSISAIASKLGMPILLTEKTSLPDCVSQFMEGKNTGKTYIIGGIGVIDNGAAASVHGAIRLGGNDRYETNAMILSEFADILDFASIYVAVGDGPNRNEFADALSGAVLAAATSSPVILTYNTLHSAIGNFLRQHMTADTTAVALGGESVVPQSILDEILALRSVDNQGEQQLPGGSIPGGGGVEQVTVTMSVIFTGLPDSESIQNSGVIDASGMSGSTKAYGFRFVSDKDCVIKYVSLTNAAGRDIIGKIDSPPTVALSAGTSGQMSIYEIGDRLGYDDISHIIGSDGIALSTLRQLCNDRVVFNGAIMVDGSNAGSIQVVLRLP